MPATFQDLSNNSAKTCSTKLLAFCWIPSDILQMIGPRDKCENWKAHFCLADVHAAGYCEGTPFTSQASQTAGFFMTSNQPNPRSPGSLTGLDPPFDCKGNSWNCYTCGVCHETYGPSPRLLNTTSCKVLLVPNFNKACCFFQMLLITRDQNDWNTVKPVCSWSGAWAWEHFWSKRGQILDIWYLQKVYKSFSNSCGRP